MQSSATRSLLRAACRRINVNAGTALPDFTELRNSYDLAGVLQQQQRVPAGFPHLGRSILAPSFVISKARCPGDLKEGPKRTRSEDLHARWRGRPMRPVEHPHYAVSAIKLSTRFQL